MKLLLYLNGLVQKRALRPTYYSHIKLSMRTRFHFQVALLEQYQNQGWWRLMQ